MTSTIPEMELNDGHKIPAIGFGTYALNGAAGAEKISNAIQMGYRLIDTAFNYENEGAVGRAVSQSGVPREEVLISSKLPGRHHAYKEAITTIEESLYRAGLDYYDFYLIHWPNPKVDLYVEAWQAMIEARKRGLIRSIGVSNFFPEHIQRLIQETGVAPSLNQIELHPHFDNDALRTWNREQGIITESWSPLGRGSSILENEHIAQIGQAYNKSISQVILRWHVQLGSVPIPKAASAEHQHDNLNIFDFELTEDEMAVISGLSSPSGRIDDQDPATYEEF